MKIRLVITSVFVALLLFGVNAIDASPVPLGNASQFSALALNGNVTMSGGAIIQGNVGVAASGFTFQQDKFAYDAYVNTTSTITPTLPPAQVHQNTATDAFLSQAVTDAKNASSQATAMGPGTNLTLSGGTSGNITLAAPGTYVYTVTAFTNNTTIAISAPAGTQVIINIPVALAHTLTSTLSGGITASNVLFNVTSTNTYNTGGSGGINGILLAPNSTIEVSGGFTVTGQVIANSVSVDGGGQILGPVVPEPSSLSVVVIGTVALLGHRFFRRRKSPG
jgi:hypothetical protein